MIKSTVLREIKNNIKNYLDKYNALHHIITMTQRVILTPKSHKYLQEE